MRWNKFFQAPSIILLSLILALSPLPGLADRPIHSHRDAVYVQIRTPLNVQTTLDGSTFEGITRENYYYQNFSIPEGTLLSGHVHRIKPSRRFTRPGYLQLDIEQAKFPSGRIVQLSHSSDESLHTLRTHKLTHPEAVRFPVLLEMGLGLTAGSAAVDIPVKIITGWSFAIILGVGTGVRIIEGIAAEYLPGERRRHNHTGDSWPKRYTHGFLRGIGAMGVYYLFKLSPNPKLDEGEMLRIRFEKHGLETLFKAASQEAIPPTTSPIDTTLE